MYITVHIFKSLICPVLIHLNVFKILSSEIIVEYIMSYVMTHYSNRLNFSGYREILCTSNAGLQFKQFKHTSKKQR